MTFETASMLRPYDCHTKLGCLTIGTPLENRKPILVGVQHAGPSRGPQAAFQVNVNALLYNVGATRASPLQYYATDSVKTSGNCYNRKLAPMLAPQHASTRHAFQVCRPRCAFQPAIIRNVLEVQDPAVVRNAGGRVLKEPVASGRAAAVDISPDHVPDIVVPDYRVRPGPFDPGPGAVRGVGIGKDVHYAPSGYGVEHGGGISGLGVE